MAVLRVGSFNVWRESTPDKVRADLAKVLPNSDLVGCQEAFHWIGVLRDVAPKFGFAVLVPNHPDEARNNPILYRPDVLEPYGSLETSLGSPKSKIAKLTPARYINRQRFKHLQSDRYVVFYNTHFTQHVESRGLPLPLPRIQLYATQMRRLTEEMTHHSNSRVVVATADWNVNQKVDGKYRWFPKSAMTRISARSNYAALGFPDGGGTHGPRFIDAAFLVSRPFSHFLSHVIIRGLNSDHNALVATVRLSPA